MKTIQILTFVLFIVEAALLGIGLLVNSSLFKSLEEKYPRYYEAIGKPKAFGNALPDINDYIQRIKGGTVILRMVFQGIPKDFPKDAQLRKTAGFIRYLFAGIIVTFAALIICGYFAFV